VVIDVSTDTPESDLVAAVVAALRPTDDSQHIGCTVRELAAATGRDPDAVREALGVLSAEGKLDCEYAKRRNITGVYHGIPCYRLKGVTRSSQADSDAAAPTDP